MGIWDTYQSRVDVHGNTKRQAALNREVRMLNNKLPDSLSYHSVTVDDVAQNVSVINSDNLNEKSIISLPGETLDPGALVFWMDAYWLITEKDFNTTVYTKCKMVQCNYRLKWVDDEDEIHEQWCIVEDGTKYLAGELEDRNFVITRGDSRIAITIARNEHTVKLNRNNRFLVDDKDSGTMLAYTLSKPLKVGGVYDNKGVYKFVLQEVSSTKDDNYELGIADYYKHFPKGTNITNVDDMDMPTQSNGKKVWL